MKLFYCLCFLCLSFSTYSQQDTSRAKNQPDNITTKNLAEQEAARKKLIARRDSIVTAVSTELKVPKPKIEDALTAFAVAAENMRQVSNNDELTSNEKSQQFGVIAERREATLKSLLTAEQIDKVKVYIISRKIPRKLELDGGGKNTIPYLLF